MLHFVGMGPTRPTKCLLTVLAAVLALSGHLIAQTSATSTDRFAWDVSDGLLAAQRYTYTLEIDGTLRSGPVPVTCASTSAGVTCLTPIPALTPGGHTLRVKATDTVDGVPVDSSFSAPLAFTLRAVPTAPNNVRILPAGA